MNMKDIKELIKIFEKAGIAELEIEEGESRLYLSKNANFAAPVQSVPSSTGEPVSQPVKEPEKEAGNTIDSPMIGTYYSSSTPGGASYVNAGDIAEKGQTLCIIEAMKIMNTIEAEYRMRILKVLMENASPVEYGQPIFLVEAV